MSVNSEQKRETNLEKQSEGRILILYLRCLGCFKRDAPRNWELLMTKLIYLWLLANVTRREDNSRNTVDVLLALHLSLIHI